MNWQISNLWSSSTGIQRSVAFAQMLSQSNDANYIRFWLTSVFAGLKKPDEVITDAGEALILAAVQTFAKCPTTNRYISACMKALIDGDPPPPCFIRLDRSHFVRSILRNKQLQSFDERVIRMIKGVIGYLMQCDSIDTVKSVLIHVFTLTNNEFVSQRVIKSKEFLTKLIKTHNIFDEYADSDCADDEVDERNKDHLSAEKDTYKETISFQWLKTMIDSVPIQKPSKQEASLVDNIFFCKKLVEFLLKIFVRVPMWSNVMCGACGSANFSPSSSASESEFKNIKRLIGIKTKRVDVFVDQHLKHLSGNMKLELETQKNQTLRENTISMSQQAKTISVARSQTRSSSVSKVRKSLLDDTSVDCLQRSMSENDITETSGANAANVTVSSASDVSMEIRKDEIPLEDSAQVETVDIKPA